MYWTRVIIKEQWTLHEQVDCLCLLMHYTCNYKARFVLDKCSLAYIIMTEAYLSCNFITLFLLYFFLNIFFLWLCLSEKRVSFKTIKCHCPKIINSVLMLPPPGDTSYRWMSAKTNLRSLHKPVLDYIILTKGLLFQSKWYQFTFLRNWL